jgi:glycerol-3-phosphate acyltransferase PlsY
MTLDLTVRVLLVLLGAYLLGSIPFGVIIGKLYGVNVLKVGSGSTGTTNVMRAVGFWPGLFVLLADMSKGAAATYLSSIILHDPLLVIISGFTAVFAHSCSPFIGFKGGKSAATGVGVILIISWQTFLIISIIVGLILYLSRYQSLATLIGSALTPVLMFLFGLDKTYILVTVAGVLFIWYKHIPNIKRLLAGTENKIGVKVQQKSSRKK